MDLVINISLGVLTTAICFMAGLLFRSFIGFVFDKKPAGKIWLVRKNEPISLVITSAPIKHQDEGTGLVYPTEATAAAEVALFLRETFTSKTQIHTSENFPDAALQGDLVVIGGPVHNELTRHLLEKTGAGDLVQGYSLVGKSGTEYESETSNFAGKERVTRDYGLVIRTANPYNSDKRLTLLIGSRTAGVLAASRALIDPMIRPTAKAIHSGKDFHLLVGANVINNEPGKLEIEESW